MQSQKELARIARRADYHFSNNYDHLDWIKRKIFQGGKVKFGRHTYCNPKLDQFRGQSVWIYFDAQCIERMPIAVDIPGGRVDVYCATHLDRSEIRQARQLIFNPTSDC